MDGDTRGDEHAHPRVAPSGAGERAGAEGSPPPSSMKGSLPSRLGRLIDSVGGLRERPEPAPGHRLRPLEWAILVAIPLVATLAALVAGRAAVKSVRAESYDAEAVQQFTQQQQLTAGDYGQAFQDLRLLPLYQESVRSWRLLSQDAEKTSDRTLQNQLRAEAEGAQD